MAISGDSIKISPGQTLTPGAYTGGDTALHADPVYFNLILMPIFLFVYELFTLGIALPGSEVPQEYHRGSPLSFQPAKT